MKLYTKDELITAIKKIAKQGWLPSVKKTTDIRNDGAVGNTLEVLLGIKENNLPIPNAQEWELKGQRAHTSSLITLKHIEPSPQGARITAQLLLKFYGWAHKQAGLKYPPEEKSFRSTTYADGFTSRGFRIIVDHEQKKLRFIFDASKIDPENKAIMKWLEGVEKNIGLKALEPEPYWGFADLEHAIGSKIKNCFYVIADSKMEEGHEYFLYKELLILSGFTFEGFLKCFESGDAYVDFDARSGHNHGTKFRIRQNRWDMLYTSVKKIELI